MDQPDNDQSDEDDWGASKKKRKKNNNQLGGSSKPRRNAGSSVNTMGNSGSNNSTPNVEPRFICEGFLIVLKVAVKTFSNFSGTSKSHEHF